MVQLGSCGMKTGLMNPRHGTEAPYCGIEAWVGGA